jgi:Holliday junction resolvase RusA-like endonuclease
MEGPLVMTIDAYRKRHRGDVDNILKLSLDALNHIAYEDDSQIVSITVNIHDDASDPRLEITLREAML